MCTAVTYKTCDHYFGRNLDLEYSYHETVTITPRHFPFSFRKMGILPRHFAMIGMAFVAEDYPLYYEATNEKGLSMAGLNFPENAFYPEYKEGADNVSPFEFIPWILGQCATVSQARALLKGINLVNIPFSRALPLSPLHWIIADRSESIVVESMKEGLKIFDNPVGVLTNNPPFDYQMFSLNNYMALSPTPPQNHFCKTLPLHTYSRGMGALGLPGDLSSQSRFIRAAFTKNNSLSGTSEEESISQFFHILTSVEQQRGCVYMGNDAYEITLYSSCCNTDKGIYYYTTYENHQITAVHMHHENLDHSALVSYELQKKQQIYLQN